MTDRSVAVEADEATGPTFGSTVAIDLTALDAAAAQLHTAACDYDPCPGWEANTEEVRHRWTAYARQAVYGYLAALEKGK